MGKFDFGEALETSKNYSADVVQKKPVKGPSCEKILVEKNLEKLRKALPEDLEVYADTLKAFSKVKSDCFGQDLKPGYEQNIDAFSALFDELKISETPKIHYIKRHVKEFCQMTRKALGQYSEQASESVHRSRFFEKITQTKWGFKPSAKISKAMWEIFIF